MLADSQTFLRCDPGSTGYDFNQSLAFPPTNKKVRWWQASHFCSSQESFTLHGRAAGEDQAFLVVQGAWGADAALAAHAAYYAITRVLKDQGLTVVHERLFGSLAVKDAVLCARAEALRAGNLSPEGPLTYIQGLPPWGEGLAGVIIQAVAREEAWVIQDRGQAVGRGWRRGDTTFYLLQNLQGLATDGYDDNARPCQVRSLIHSAVRLLEDQGVSYRNVARTWFYLEDILAWYPEFNRARSAVYRKLGLMPTNGGGTPWLPASTGIQGEVSGDAACALDLLAVAGPPESRTMVKQLRSPAQPDALSYGSAFSRGVLIQQSDVAVIQVSGTAAIDEQGKSLYPGDIRSQIDCTFDKVAALIGQEGASLQDIAAACVFVKRPLDALVYQERARALGLENLPAVIMLADICRPELLFEIDAEVVFKPGRRGHE
jgi:enamine deaminase RidA (YjgF/YER057c/UK114 family)